MALIVPGRLIYLHVPKTAGKWTKSVLRPQLAGAKLFNATNHGNEWARYGHPDFEDVRGLEGFRFAFVRHPVEWWRSYWRHHQVRGGFKNERLELVRLTRAETFDEYVDNVLTRLPGFASRMFARYVGEPGDEVDFIGRHERMKEDLRTALDMAGLDVDAIDLSAPPTNSGGEDTEHFDFSPAQRAALSLAEAEGIERFGYERWH